MKKQQKDMRIRIDKYKNIEIGILLSLLLAVVGLYTFQFLYYKLILVILVFTILIPGIFYPISFVWFSLAIYVEKITSTLILACIYFLIVTPIGLFRNIILKAGLLGLGKFKKGKSSVFITRNIEYKKNDLINQF